LQTLLVNVLANSAVGYGYVWLVVQGASENNSCLFMNNGAFTLNTWSWSTGLVWVSEIFGVLQQQYPSNSGDRLVSAVGTVFKCNNDTI
jgi:hypothetical protein